MSVCSASQSVAVCCAKRSRWNSSGSRRSNSLLCFQLPKLLSDMIYSHSNMSARQSQLNRGTMGRGCLFNYHIRTAVCQ